MRLLGSGALFLAVGSVLLALPGLGAVRRDISHLGAGWALLAVALELASCSSFVVIFRHFFAPLPAGAARALAWTEMGSGAVLPGGGVGSLAVGGWLLHEAGMGTARILRSSAGLFFLTSAINVIALISGAAALGLGLSAGGGGTALWVLPMLGAVAAVAAVLLAARLGERRSSMAQMSPRLSSIVAGVGEALGALRRPNWRLAGAAGYLGFDIAVLWATLGGVGYSPPLAVLMLGYIIGYLANLLPVPGGIGVLEGGLAGTLVLYGAPVAQATAGVLIYHAIAFWIPTLGGVEGYRRVRRELGSLPGPTSSERNSAREAIPPMSALGVISDHVQTDEGDPMSNERLSFRPASPAHEARPVAPGRVPLRTVRAAGRETEAQVIAWLRALPGGRGDARRAAGRGRPAVSAHPGPTP